MLSSAQWQADLDSLVQILRQRLIYGEDAYGSRRLTRRVDSLKSLVREQTRAERILSVARLLDLPAPGTGHSTLPFIQRAIGWRLLPMRIFESDDGYYVVHAKGGNLIGNEVRAIGDTPADSVAAALAPWGIVSFVEPLEAAGEVERGDPIPVRMRSSSGREVTLNVEPNGAWTHSIVRYEKGLQEPVKGNGLPRMPTRESEGAGIPTATRPTCSMCSSTASGTRLRRTGPGLEGHHVRVGAGRLRLHPTNRGHPHRSVRAGRRAAPRCSGLGLTLDRSITSVLTGRADTLEAKDRPLDALLDNQLAVELFPKSWRVYSSLAHNYELIGRADEAISAYQRLRTLDPSRREAVNERLRELKQPNQGNE